MRLHTFVKISLAAAAIAAVGSANAASLNAGGYVQSFDSLVNSNTGTTAVSALPDGWTKYVAAGSHSDWSATTGITASGVAAMTVDTTALDNRNAPTANNSAHGYNAANPFTTTSDRAIVTAPTGDRGNAFQLTLTNNTGSALNSLNLSYDVIRYTGVNNANGGGSPQEELPGFELFFSTDGNTWTNAPSFTVTNAANPNYITTTGLDTFTGPLAFANAVSNGANLYLRWVDDNGVLSSPDQLLGLNNVSVAPVPLPAGLPLLVSALGALGAFGRRSKKQQNAA